MVGTARAIDETGRLCVDTGGQTVAISAGDITHLRPSVSSASVGYPESVLAGDEQVRLPRHHTGNGLIGTVIVLILASAAASSVPQ